MAGLTSGDRRRHAHACSTALAWRAFGELGLSLLFRGLGALAVYTLIVLVPRERMQFHGCLPSPSRREEPTNDQSQV